MKLTPDHLLLSASDLANHLACRHLTTLDHAVVEGTLERPAWHDPALDILRQRGQEHERAYLAHLERRGLSIRRLEDDLDSERAFDRTRAAMREGAEVIVQATLAGGRWHGRADVLLRVDWPSGLGDWSYEVVDTKLTRETRPGTVLQLCLYSDLVSEIQRAAPEHMHVVSPSDDYAPESFRVLDYMAYYRMVRRRLEAVLDATAPPDGAPATYPDPVPHCDICRWWYSCDRRRRADDHLCLVAGMSRLQTKELNGWEVTTLTSLALLPLPLERRPRRGALEGYVRVREQARVQLEGRDSEPVYELLPREPGRGLAHLPAPSPGDIFLDLEGDPYVGRNGLEYLFGYVVAEADGELRHHGRWSTSREEEKAAFEAFVDMVMERWQRQPDLHVYHFAHYEPSALRRLMGAHATREGEVDRMLRARLFVDLYAVVKQALRASVERYSIKDLEIFFGYVRERRLEEAGKARRVVERALELGHADGITEELREVVQSYNRDDCMSAARLRDWLEGLRAERVANGETIARPDPQAGEASDSIADRERRTQELFEALMEGVPAEPTFRSPEQHARCLLAHMLEWHRREDKAPWWEYYRLLDLSDEDLLYEKAAISGLAHAERGTSKKSVLDRYRFPRQETSVRAGDELHATDGNIIGAVEAIDLVACHVDIKKRGDAANLHPTAVFSHKVVNSQVLAESLFRLGQWVSSHGVDAREPNRAACDLLLRLPPRLSGAPAPLRREDEGALDAARRLALALDHGILPIQGPPGSGKTFTGARMILDLVREGRKVGVTAVSHKVVRNLLDWVVRVAEEEGDSVRCLQKVSDADRAPLGDPRVTEALTNAEVLRALEAGEAQVAGGTPWLWARPEFAGSVDLLFVDEAGQMSLANALAVAQAGTSIVLLGDPQQLDQPLQGSHPEGTDASALEHVLGDHATMPEERGLFLPETWRLHPEIGAFTSELFYEDRLTSRRGLERQALVGPTPFAGAGLWFVPVEHEGNQSFSEEEVERVAGLVEALQREGVGWVDANEAQRPLRLEDILVIAPYNAQVADLEARLPTGARVGTVDKFQGQEAPVVIYSMTTSSPEDAPRGMEFLYSLNRFNVATSRGRCACILVGSPRLCEPECRSPKQMRLANAVCRYVERARVVR